MFDGFIRDHARWTPRAPAVITATRVAAYAELDADVDRCGAALAAMGVHAGRGVVSVQVEEPYLAFVAMAALARLGVASSPAADHAADLRLVDHSRSGDGPPALVLDRAWQAAMYAAEPRPLPVLELDRDATGRVMLSSGTTRLPRRCAYTWGRLEHGNHLSLRTYCQGKMGAWIPLTGLDAAMGLTMAIGAWSVGASVTAPFAPEDTPAFLEALTPGLVAMAPMHLQRLLAALPPGFQPQPEWRLVVGGAPLPPSVAREARLRISPDIRTIYGSTEGGMSGLGYASGLDDAPGQVGITPAGAIVDIVDDDGRPVPEGQSGEVRIRGERVVAGYIGEPEATAERFRDGWFYTNDIGRRLPDGRIVLEGRADERMNLGGVKFMPGVLEAAALECAGVRDCAAFAAPDEAGLDACWLAVVADPAFDRSGLAPHLARYQNLPPPKFAWIDAIPRNTMGKVERTKLRDLLLAAIRPS